MASLFSHSVAALALGTVILERPWRWALLLLGVLCAVMPDADVIAFAVGIPYEDMAGHRGITHSLYVAATVAGVGTWVVRGRWDTRVFLFLLLATASHGLLDAMTAGGRGVAFFAPFSDRRYFLPWRPIPVSPIHASEFFGREGLVILRTELLVIWLPSLALVLAGLALRRRVAAGPGTSSQRG